MSSDRQDPSTSPALRGEPATAAAGEPRSGLDALSDRVGRGLLQRKLQRRALQRQGPGAVLGGGADVAEAAAHGTRGAAGALPHLDAIQRSFGDHEVGHVQAHTDGAAAEGARAIGAEAFATGDHVAFAGPPSLHTAAHEAAHVVQQQAGVQLTGGIGRDGDAHEQHADQVADLVVQGRPAGPLLDQYGGAAAARGGVAVQRKNSKVKDEGEDDEDEVAAVGAIDKAKALGSRTIHWYDWTRADGFTRTARAVVKGKALQEARRVSGNADYAWVRTEDEQVGYLRVTNLTVDTWGTDKTPSPVGGDGLLETVDGKPDRRYKDTNREWYLDQAVLMRAYRSLKDQDPTGADPDTQQTMKQLALAMFQAFSKGASMEQGQIGDKIGAQSTAFQPNKTYYRSGAGGENAPPALRYLSHLVSEDMGATADQIQLLSDPLFMEVLAREFPVYSGAELAKHDVGPQPVETRIDSIATFGTSIDALIHNFDAGIKPDHTFVFDVSVLYTALACDPKTVKATLSLPLEQALLARVETYASAHPGKDQELIGCLLDRLQLVAILKQKTVDVLFVVPFLGRMPKAEADATFTAEQANLRGQVDQRQTHDGDGNAIPQAEQLGHRTRFTTPGAHDPGKLDSTMIESGARIDPIAAKQAMLEFATAEQILAKHLLPTMDLATSSARTPTIFKNGITGFLASGTFARFRALSDEKDAPPYQVIYPKATADLLDGLARCNLDDGGIDQVFADKQIDEVLQTGYYRMLNAMGGALNFKGDIVGFLNNIEVIHDQLQMILSICAPHEEGVVFSRAIVDQLKSAPKGERPTVPEGLDPQVHHKASAMHSVASILSSAEDQKEQDTGSRSLNAVVLKDNYYEAFGALADHTRTYDVSILDGDQLRADADKASPKEDGKSKSKSKSKAKADEVKPIEGAMPLDASAFEGGKKPNGIDLFICDFHHNISLTRSHYSVEDVTAQVARMYATEGMVAPQFTVAIDCTVDFLRSDDIRGFLETFKDKITGGAMNVVLYRSAQKFDMLGMDNYYGGFTVTINDGGSFDAFNERIARKEDQVGGLAHQGMAHLAKHASGHADEYRQLLMANTQKLYKALPGACRFGADSPLQIALTDDPNAVFLDIQFPGYSEKFATGPFYKHFLNWAQAEGLAFTTRPSFGFATTNFTTIQGSKVRLNPGLEDEAAIGKYVGYFESLQRVLAGVEAKLLAGRARTALGVDAAVLETAFAAALKGDAFGDAFEDWRTRHKADGPRKHKPAVDGEEPVIEGPELDGGARKVDTVDEALGRPASGGKKAARARRQLGSSDGHQQLDVHGTVGDGSCGIHAGLGASDPRGGEYRHADPAAVRADIAERITDGDVDVPKYERMIAEILRSIDQRVAAKKGVGGDDGRLWIEFQKIAGILADLTAVRDAERDRKQQRSDDRAGLVTRYRTCVTDPDHKYRPLRQQLVAEIMASNAESDRAIKGQLRDLGEGERRAHLRDLPAEYLSKLINACFDRLHPTAQGIEGLDELSEAHAAHRDAPIPELVFGALVHARSDEFLAAYARAVASPGYYLRDADLEVMADVENRALVIYRESDLHRGQFVTHTDHHPERGNPMSVYHSGVHYEHATLHDV